MTQVSLYLFSLLELHNISVSSKMVKKVIMNLDLSKTSGPDCIPVVVLKNCEPKLSYMLAELVNKCFKESCFPDCWKISSVVSVQVNTIRPCMEYCCHIWAGALHFAASLEPLTHH